MEQCAKVNNLRYTNSTKTPCPRALLSPARSKLALPTSSLPNLHPLPTQLHLIKLLARDTPTQATQKSDT